MAKRKKCSASISKFVPYGEFVHADFYLTLFKDMKLDFEFRIDPCEDRSGVILFFNVIGKKED